MTIICALLAAINVGRAAATSAGTLVTCGDDASAGSAVDRPASDGDDAAAGWIAAAGMTEKRAVTLAAVAWVAWLAASTDTGVEAGVA